MSAFGIIQLHDDITRSNGNYCSICFRLASERRLVEPVFLNMFLNNTNGRRYFKKQIKACYMCEALATSAVRFQKAVELASQVGVLYDDITATGHWQSVVKCLMDRQTATNKVRGITGSILQRALAMDKTLRSAPRYELLTTDTLVVSSVKDKSSPPPPPAPPAPAPPPAQPARPPPLSDTVVIVDDEEPPAPAHVRVLNQATDEVVLHPVLKGSDGKFYVPSLHLQMLDGGLFQCVSDVQMQNLLPPQATTPTNNNLYIQNNSQLPQLIVTQPNTTFVQNNSQAPQLIVTQSNTNNGLYVQNNSHTPQLTVTQTNNNLYVQNNSQAPQLTVTQSKTNNGLYVQNNSHTPQLTVTQANNNLYVQNNSQAPQLTVTQSNTNNGLYVQKNSHTPQRTQSNTNNNKYVQNNSQVTNNSRNQTFVHTPRKYSNTKKTQKKPDEKTDYLNFYLTQNPKQNDSNLEIIKMNDMNIVLHDTVKKRRLPEDPLHIENTRNNKQNIENQGTEMRYEIIDDEIESPGNGMTESRRPVLRTDQTVDWEDKIPMDVISFMDATDPNPSERIMQPPSLPPPPPLAVIADVRSVPDVPDVPDDPDVPDVPELDVPDDPDVTHVPELIECIDLC